MLISSFYKPYTTEKGAAGENSGKMSCRQFLILVQQNMKGGMLVYK